MKFPPYPRYKPSGVAWLGEVPEHWDALALKRRFHIVNGGTPSSSEDTYWEGDIPWFTPEDLGRIETKVISTSRRQITEDGLANCGASLSPRGSVLISTRAPIGHVAVMGVDGCCNQGCRILVREGVTVSADFAFYVVVASNAVLNSVGKGTTFLELSAGALGAHLIPLPAPAEQLAIAAFLDRETGRVDRLVAKKRELIERLKEKRTALISHTVTRGLPPAAARAADLPENPPLKPSGLDWLGDIPKHWGVLPIKHLLSAILDTEHKTCPFYEDGEFLVARTPNIRDGKLLREGAKYTDADGYREWTARGKPKPRDILFTREAPAGEACIVPSEPPLCIGQRVVLFRTDPRRLDSRFAIYSIYGGAARVFIQMQSLGSTVTHFNMSEIAMIPMLVPPLPEQTAIAAYLEKETAKLDALLGKVEEAVERLQEYRTALITAAVTGKIDVRKAVLPEVVS